MMVCNKLIELFQVQYHSIFALLLLRSEKNIWDKLISLIERFGLDRYDNPKQGRKEKRTIKKVATHNAAQRHRVQKGDTLYSISKQYNVSVAILREVNQLESSTIYLGQEIIIPKN